MSSLELQVSRKLHGKASAAESGRMSFAKSRSLWLVFSSEFCENVVEQVHLSMVKKRNKHVLSISKRSYVVGRRNVFLVTLSRYFSHVTKSRMFKNLNLRKKADRNFRRTLLKNRFRHLKLYSNPPSWLARSRCHMGTFWKTKDWSSHLWEGQPFRFWYVEFNRQRRLKSTKTGISF